MITCAQRKIGQTKNYQPNHNCSYLVVSWAVQSNTRKFFVIAENIYHLVGSVTNLRNIWLYSIILVSV